MSSYRFLLLVAAAVPACAQARFEVASIRLAPGATVQDSRFVFRGDRFEAKAAAVGDMIDMLGGFQLYRVTGGPAWMRTDRYDIVAKADRVLEDADRILAVTALLAERFKLESHRETREVPGLVLRAPRNPQDLKRAGSDESTSVRPNDRDDMVFTAAPMSRVVNYLSQMWGAPVVNETDLDGAYDFVLPISLITPQPQESWGDRVRETVEVFGFRVENRRIPLEITVVDRCDPPSAN